MLPWEYDPSDGEIRAIIEFPLDESFLTKQQFNHCLLQMSSACRFCRDFSVEGGDGNRSRSRKCRIILLSIQQQAPGLLDIQRT